MPVFRNILLVDDDEITITICERLMKISHFADVVTSCLNGQEAREYLLLNFPVFPDVILLDLHMGIMNGWEFLDWYQNWTRSLVQYPPIYVLSSSLSKEDIKRAESYMQVKGYIIKPMTVEHLNDITAKCFA